MKYCKKPIVVEAYRTMAPMDIDTPEGTMRASPGDYIIVANPTDFARVGRITILVEAHQVLQI